MDIDSKIQNASTIFVSIGPLQPFIYRNPLEELEFLPFEEAIAASSKYLDAKGLREDEVNRELIKWCQAFLDEGMASLQMPGREKGFYRAWRLLAPHDAILCLGEKGERLSTLPHSPDEALLLCLKALALAEDRIEEYFTYALAELPGWASYIKWCSKQQQKHPINLKEFLAVRLAIVYILKKSSFCPPPAPSKPADLSLLEFREEIYLNKLLKKIDLRKKTRKRGAEMQFVFCMDVRSEPLRRKLELERNYETFSCSGLFGLPFQECAKTTCCSGLKTLFPAFYSLIDTLSFWTGLWRLKPKKRLQPIANISVPFDKQLVIVESLLRSIGMTRNFSPKVIFCGHSGSSENNPYASSLHCAACGGNPGGANAQAIAFILNQKSIREALQAKGIAIPEETLFIGAEHDTTTNQLLTNSEEVLEDIIPPSKTLIKRAIDPAEVKPESGLARNSALVIAPRKFTEAADLEGRCFLHSYEWEEDPNGQLLEAILTGPLLVAKGINLQYFFSTLKPFTYGSGSKITQNPTGFHGVMQGNASDRMPGLPLESIDLKDSALPVRLQTLIYAPLSRLDKILSRQPYLTRLVTNHWIKLVVLNPENGQAYQWNGELTWRELDKTLSPALD